MVTRSVRINKRMNAADDSLKHNNIMSSPMLSVGEDIKKGYLILKIQYNAL